MKRLEAHSNLLGWMEWGLEGVCNRWNLLKLGCLKIRVKGQVFCLALGSTLKSTP